MTKFQKFSLISFCAFVFLLCITQAPAKAHAATHTVTTFEQLQSALADGDDTIDITISASFDMTSTLTIPAGKNVTISSGDGGPFILTRGTSATGDLITVSASASLTLSNITVDGNKTAIIDAGGSLVYVSENGELTINDGAALQNNYNVDPMNYRWGGAVNNMGSTTMSGGIISGNAALDGGGIYNYRYFTMTGGVIKDNTADYYGGGVSSVGEFTLTNGVISGNTSARDGGGVYNMSFFIDWGGGFHMAGGTISSNAAETGGGIYNTGILTVSDGSILNNEAQSGGGIFNNQQFTLSGGIIDSNEAYLGGGIMHQSYFFTISGGSISNNTAQLGGGISTAGGAKIVMSDGFIDNNTAALGGGGIYLFHGTLEMSGGTISGNKSDGTGGGFHGESIGAFIMTGGEILKNEAERGGGVYNMGSDFGVSISNSKISGNHAMEGGGFYSYGASHYPGYFHLSNSEVSGNTADYGGGIYGMFGILQLSGNDIRGNAAAFDGGGIYSNYVTVQLSNDTVSGNTAARDGGGIFTLEYYYLDLTADSTVAFSGNTAGSLSVPPETAPVPEYQWQGTVTSISLAIPGDKNITAFNNFDINFDGDPFAGPFPVIYHANNGSGDELDAGSKFPYQPFTIENNTFTTSGKRFVSWNTKADGSGTTYLPGDEAVMPNEDAPFTFNLYAMWEPVPITPETPETPATAPPPKTGDTNALSLYGMLLCAAIGLAVCASVFAKKKRNS